MIVNILLCQKRTVDLWQGKKIKNALNKFSFPNVWDVTVGCKTGWVKDCGIEKVRTAMISSVPCPQVSISGAGDSFCFCFFPVLFFQCRQAPPPEHTLAFLGCLCWFFSTYFFCPTPLSPVVTNTFLPLTSPICCQIHSPFFFPFLSSAVVL